MLYSLSVLNSPATGDSRNVVLYMVIALIAAILIVVYILLGRKNKNK